MKIAKVGILSIAVLLSAMSLCKGTAFAEEKKGAEATKVEKKSPDPKADKKSSDAPKSEDGKNVVKLNAKDGKGTPPFSRPAAIDAKKLEIAPPSKGGPKTRAHWCKVYVENYTAWPVSIYMNSKWVGDVPAWGTSTLEATGVIQLKGLVNFVGGNYKLWDYSPVNFGTYDVYTYKLYP